MVSLEDWLGDGVFKVLPFRKTAWTLLKVRCSSIRDGVFNRAHLLSAQGGAKVGT